MCCFLIELFGITINYRDYHINNFVLTGSIAIGILLTLLIMKKKKVMEKCLKESTMLKQYAKKVELFDLVLVVPFIVICLLGYSGVSIYYAGLTVFAWITATSYLWYIKTVLNEKQFENLK